MLQPELQRQLQPFLESVGAAHKALLMLDYDGTLAPFKKERDQAFPVAGLSDTLQKIVRDLHTRLVIVSGRDVSELIQLLRIDPVPELWGLHGLQRRRQDGTCELERFEQRHLEALLDARRWLEYQRLTNTAEFKAGSIAVHWRGQEDHESDDVRMRVLLGWERIAEVTGLQILEFDGGVEIRVPGSNKGDAVRRLLAEIGPKAPAAYLGDDLTDEPAFRELQGCGLSVLVRPEWRPTAAQLWMKSPAEVLEFLDLWLSASRKGHTSSGASAGAVNR